MKHITKLTGFFICLFLTISATSQTTINASDIMKDLKKGKDITYKNATIVGVLDFTFMDDALPNLPKRRKWYNNGSNTVKKEIKSNVSFENCVFEDHVFAYIHDEDSGYTFTANFEEDAIFKNCRFKEMSMFKYSTFKGKSDFSNSSFMSNSTFKYAVFKNNVSFSNTTFKESATFKYTNFKNGVSFSKARFEEDLNLKYTKVSRAMGALYRPNIRMALWCASALIVTKAWAM